MQIIDLTTGTSTTIPADVINAVFAQVKREPWNIKQQCGYTPFTTFWEDLIIAEIIDASPGIIDTVTRALKEWEHDVKYIAELSLALNHRGWVWYDRVERLKEALANNPDNDKLRKLYEHADDICDTYFDQWQKIEYYAEKRYKGADADYYFSVTD